MAYKFQRGAATASGSFTAENGLTSNNALSVTAGTSALQAVTATTISGSGTLQAGGLATLNGGVNSTNISGSGTLQAGGAATIGNGLTVAFGGAIITGSVAVNGSITSTGNISVTAGVLSASNAVQTAGNVVAAGRVQGQTLTASVGSTLAATTVTTITGSGAAIFASLTVDSVDINGGTIDASDITVGSGKTLNVSAGTLTLAAGQVGADKVGAGTFNAGTFSFNGSTISDLGTVTTADINGGTIDGTNIGASSVGTGQFSTLSASSTLQVAGITTLNDALTVSAGGVTVSAGGLSVNSGDSSVQKLTVNGDLIVLGTTISASVSNLVIEDKQIVLADGAGSAAAAAGAGFFVSGANVEWTYKQNGEGSAASSGDIFVASGSSGLVDIQAANFYGTLVGTMASPVTLVADAGTLVTGVNYFADVAGASSVNLPAAPSVGDSVRVKAPSNCNTTNTITINRQGSHTIDAETFIVLESPFAAVECVYVATNLWRIF